MTDTPISMKIKRILFLVVIAGIVAFLMVLGFAVIAAFAAIGLIYWAYVRYLRPFLNRNEEPLMSPEEPTTETLRVFDAEYEIINEDDVEK